MAGGQKRRVRISQLPLLILVLLLLVVQVRFMPLGVLDKTAESIGIDRGSSYSTLARVASRVVMYAPNGSPYVIVTTGTYAYQSYVQNFGCSLGAVGNRSALLLTFDRELYRAPLSRNLVPYLFDSGPMQVYLRYDTEEFDAFTRRKFEAAVAVLRSGYDVLFADADTVWCDSRAPWDIAASAERLSADLVFQHPVHESQVINTGLYYARANRNTIQFLEAASRFPGGNDQVAANNMACHKKNGGLRVRQGDNKQEYCIWNNTTTIGVLDAYRYPIGCTKFGGKQFKFLPWEDADAMCRNGTVGLVHYSCYRDNTKLAHMRRNRMWHVQGKDDDCNFRN